MDGKSSGGGGSKGGNGGQGGKGGGKQGAGFPSTTKNPSGGGRDSNPAKGK